MKLSTQPYKGTRDFYPEDMRLRNWMFNKMRGACESFGYEEYDAPILEPLELFASKTSEEVVNEQSYSFTDRGDRKVIMRPEITPSVSRMVAARRQELGYPLRLFSIPNCFRYERPQKGRLREFWQLNADIFGVEGIEADIEAIKLTDAILKNFGATEDMYEIRINSRKLLNKRIEEAGVKSSIDKVIRIIDRYDKQDRAQTLEQLAVEVEQPEKLLSSLEKDGPSSEVEKIAKQLESLGITNVKPTETLARGFDYYTDIVFEVFDTNAENNRSMFGGGRYDGLVGLFGVEPVPSVGFGMGDVALANFLESNGLIPDLKPATNLAVLLVGDVYEQSAELVNKLRENLNVSVDPTDRKLEKKIKAADKQGLEYVLFVGEEELKNKVYQLKNLKTGETQVLGIDDIAKKLA